MNDRLKLYGNQVFNMKIIRKTIISLISICLTVGLISANSQTLKAVSEVTDDMLYEEIETYVLEEEESLREESSKTFLMSDGSHQKIIYSLPVHYEENNKWNEIDNTLVSDESDSDVRGYRNRDGKLEKI